MGSEHTILNKLAPKILTEDFARYEFKYLLPLALRQSIEGEIQDFMRADGHSDPDLDNQYLVRSLYFDSLDSQAFYEKTDGVKSRNKFRIRTYARDFNRSAPIFLEEKGRYNERTYKHRVKLEQQDLDLIFGELNAFDLIARYPEIEVVEKFAATALRKGLEPRVLVDYIRRPYTSDYDMNFRVTFDQHLQAMAASELHPSDWARAKACVAGMTIMEVKFNRRIPAWFHRILQAYDLRRISISKFVVGMKKCNLAVDLS